MKSFILLVCAVSLCFVSVHAFRDGAREESCYDHLVNHTGAIGLDCIVGDPNCRYFLVIKEVVNETTLELGNQTDSYECGRIYGSELYLQLLTNV